jgi:glycerate dehydrogenase
MAGGSLVAVSYPVDDEFVQINTGILDGLAEVAFLDGRPDAEFRDVLRQADVLLGWHLGQELPAGVLQASPGLRLIQLLSAGADSVDFAAIPERLMLASNVGAYAEPMAERPWRTPPGTSNVPLLTMRFRNRTVVSTDTSAPTMAG